MTNTQQEPVEVKRFSHRDSLARSLIGTLVILTFIPFTLMAGIAYWRSRTLFGDQITSQMQSQLTAELNQLDLTIKAKQIRLDHLVRQSDFDNDLSSALSENSQSTDFSIVRNNLTELDTHTQLLKWVQFHFINSF